MNDSTDCRAPGERPRKGQCIINGVDIRDATDTALVRLVRMRWSDHMMDLIRSEAVHRNLV